MYNLEIWLETLKSGLKRFVTTWAKGNIGVKKRGGGEKREAMSSNNISRTKNKKKIKK